MFNWLTSILSEPVTLPEKWQAEKLSDIPLLAVDLELTSLNVDESHMLSAGWVEGVSFRVNLDSCYYSVVQTEESLQQSPVIHGLTEEEVKKREEN